MDKRLLAISLVLSAGLMCLKDWLPKKYDVNCCQCNHHQNTPDLSRKNIRTKRIPEKMHECIDSYSNQVCLKVNGKHLHKQRSQIISETNVENISLREIPKLPVEETDNICLKRKKYTQPSFSQSIEECHCPDCIEDTYTPTLEKTKRIDKHEYLPSDSTNTIDTDIPSSEQDDIHSTCSACNRADYSHTSAPSYVHGCQCPACAGASHSCTPAPTYVHGCQCHTCIQTRAVENRHYCECPACSSAQNQRPQPPQHHPPPQPVSNYPDCFEETCEEECCYEPDSFITVDFLYWYARETKLVYAQKFKVVNQLIDSSNDDSATLVFAPKNTIHFDTNWDPGVRVGRGWNIDCSGWDFYFVWTYFTNCDKDTSRISEFTYGTITELPSFAQNGLLNPWINPSFSPTDVENENLPFIFNKIAGYWELVFNQIDFEIGKSFECGPCFNFRIYTGLRTAWTNTRFQTKSYREFFNTDTGMTKIIFLDRFKHKFWGAGLIGGFQPSWYFTCNYSLFGNIEASLIWGNLNAKKEERYKEMQSLVGMRINYKNNSSSKYFQLAAIIDLAIGLRWETDWCCGRFRTALDLGWEQHIWFDQNPRYKAGSPFTIHLNSSNPTMTGYSEIEETTSNLMFGGLVVRLKFEF